MNRNADMEGKVVLVTGGGRGLGEAICRSLGEVGAIVISADIRKENAQMVAVDVQACGGKAMAMGLDVASDQQAEEAISQAISQFERLDVLVNNAGIDLTLPVDELPISEWDRIMAVNLRGPFLMAKCALPIMKRQGHGHIINIVSTAAKRAWANASAYHASKWGLLGFSHALHVEARPFNIKVTAIVSGGMRTPFLLERFPDIDVSTLQDPRSVADTIRFVISQPEGVVIPEVMVIPMKETSWP